MAPSLPPDDVCRSARTAPSTPPELPKLSLARRSWPSACSCCCAPSAGCCAPGGRGMGGKLGPSGAAGIPPSRCAPSGCAYPGKPLPCNICCTVIRKVGHGHLLLW
jgi:hypothetical protein